jgi:hypothetical protein
MQEKKPKYYLSAEGKFVIENYNTAKPFANFFPGIAGKYGIPMWVFYVNRGQGIISCGTKDKDHSIMEFFPANKAWEFASLRGFRTFIKVAQNKGFTFYEPFHNGLSNAGFNLANKMSLDSSSLKIQEHNLSLGLEVNVSYFTIPNDSYSGLSRKLTIKNSSRLKKKIQLLDGLPQIIPYGTSNLFLKKLSRTIEAWMNIKNLKRNAPFYKLDIDPTDRPEIIHIEAGNFYLGFHYDQGKTKLIKPIVDPQAIFGQITDFSAPQKFITNKKFLFPKKQACVSKTPCGFSSLGITLNPGEEKTIHSIIGYMPNIEALNNALSRITKPGYLAAKEQENKRIIADLEEDISTSSSSAEFNLYAKQTYLDNILRGGYPLIFKSNQEKNIFYLYSRKHGDLERDYNKFHLQPAYFSQGNGNYRDINQNRRHNTWFNPEIGDEDLVYFFSLLQTDGFNPLVTKGVSFMLKDGSDTKKILQSLIDKEELNRVAEFLNHPFTPGDLILFLKRNKIQPKVSTDELLDQLIGHSFKIHEAEHGEGFWTDHWHYNLDLLESYLGIYPEKAEEIIFEKRIFTYYDNTETVRPRSEKHLLYNNLPRQLHAVCQDNAKKELIRKRAILPNVVRANFGNGQIYQTTLINKLLCLLANKLASLDPFGIGIEMEANKPNWFDALNGLPALFGSSLCETFELKRLVILIQGAITKNQAEKIVVTEEVYEFLSGLKIAIEENLKSDSQQKDYIYWDQSGSLKEDYRHKTRFGFSGQEKEVSSSELSLILKLSLEKLDLGINKALGKKKQLYPAYFINEVTDYAPLKTPHIKPLGFKQLKLPLFLEAQVHALRLSPDKNTAKKLHQATKSSPLYDKKLKMYKVTAPLSSMPQEIGRCRVFSPGWLENESIWLHMEYKYLLELLKRGLYHEFYENFKNTLIPFQKPHRYGRSILENSSFIVSSAFIDSGLHGNGFVARLSGSTAEFIEIWLKMNLGLNPFLLDNKGGLNLRFDPILAGWLFSQEGNYSFNFLSKIRVNYHNPARKDTFGKNKTRTEKIIFKDMEGKLVKLMQDTIPSPYAGQVRSGQIKEIDIYLV